MKDLSNMIQNLVLWYQKNARVLPWREKHCAYGVWVSEIMLQQTRVEAVKEYYVRFLEELPTVKHLAEVSDEKLLKLWQGLGYYNRAKNLKKAAIQIMEQYCGEIPNDYNKLLQLKGIGEYTAGAISSIAFGQQIAAIDGNVLRVMTRLYTDEREITDKALKKEYKESIEAILNHTNPNIFNQALMELGATICLPNGMPKCEQCPIKQYCKAYEKNNVLEFPHKATKKQRRIENRMMFFILCQNKLALHKREEKGLLSNLWELPNALTDKTNTEQLLQWGINYTDIKDIGKAKHIFTHIEWHMKGYFINANSFENTSDFIWVTQSDLQQKYALPSAFREYVIKGWNMT
ncbi:A/G-specific adenine glycosylase [Clostridium sp. MD294]|uniref:A/G-specific adenine glycosylase n=1 Tax=Clostridium sp. MD294 TaxID=97138 RepID=UPI0002C9105F|nr:A/G-specific adenine glycosylase [Clostridium sp. MD294]NDO45520.1 A/G-specific adenine glycosylase [Clostridium sp. MD294]USF30828.1 Adenine DNA glycosylase [Clostridium sp. MD294]